LLSKNLLLLLFLVPSFIWGQEDVYTSNKTFTYEQTLAAYMRLNKEFPNQTLFQPIGETDAGNPLHVFHVSNKIGPEARKKQVRILINNAIHPGEPCGVDASVKLVKELLRNDKLPDNIWIGIIPMYNISGAKNRSCCSRANQNGPEEYGFRGNAQNLDLNRDFIKADSKNAKSFAQIFDVFDPDIFIDTHTSNGADYQHVMTLITSQTDKMEKGLGDFMKNTFTPHLFEVMNNKGYPLVPYMHMVGKTPETGIFDYLETPRYSTGFAALNNTIGFVSEAHMLKPYDERVLATYELLESIVKFGSDNLTEIKNLRKKAIENQKKQDKFPIQWELDTTSYALIPFEGYRHSYIPSKVTSGDRLFYDREQPYDTNIRYYNSYTATEFVEKPKAYILPKSKHLVAERLQTIGVVMSELERDTLMEVEYYRISDYNTLDKPYEGHYLHTDVKVEKHTEFINLNKGDYFISFNGKNEGKIRFIIELLEPHAVDSYFAWNFFDANLQQKEWFSAYVFEDKAEQLLNENPNLKEEYEAALKADENLANNPWGQLYWIYTHSPYYEPSHMRYPVYRVK
jgi:hypothetical protein